MSDTVWHFANSNTFRAIFSFTCFIWAFNFTFRFFTFDITNGISWFLTTSMTTRWSFKKFYITHKLDHKLQDILGHHISKHIMDGNEVLLITLVIVFMLKIY